MMMLMKVVVRVLIVSAETRWRRWIVVCAILMLMTAGGVDAQAAPTAEPTPEATSELSATATPAVLEALVSARFETGDVRPLTGQVFTIDLIITLPPGFELVDVPQFSDPWGEFELRRVTSLERDPASDPSEGGVADTVWRQQLEVILWEPRDYMTPETYIGYRQAGFADVLRLPVTPLNVTVPTVLDFEDLSLRPYKPLIYLPYVSPWVILLVGGLVTAALVTVVRMWRNRRKRRAPEQSPSLTAAQIALFAFDGLTGTVSTPENRVIGAADILRRYLDRRTGIGLGDRSATITALQSRMPKTLLAELDSLLRWADRVKFSGVAVTASESERYLERCQQWLKAVDAALVGATVADVLMRDASAARGTE